jgi:hypothetical protein
METGAAPFKGRPFSEANKSFLVLFFKKELLSWRFPSFLSEIDKPRHST